MYGMLLKLTTKPGKRQELVDFLRWDAEVARAGEPGTLRFDVWEVPHEPDAVYLYEAYVDDAAFLTHQGHEPYQKFRDDIEPRLIDDKHVLFEGTTSVVSL